MKILGDNYKLQINETARSIQWCFTPKGENYFSMGFLAVA